MTDRVDKLAIQQICGYLINEREHVTRAELRDWVRTWLGTYCPVEPPQPTDEELRVILNGIRTEIDAMVDSNGPRPRDRHADAARRVLTELERRFGVP